MNGWRFRVDADGRLILQVLAARDGSRVSQWVERSEWRDATVGDIPVRDPFGAMTVQREQQA